MAVADIGDGEKDAEIGQRQAEDDGLVKQRVPLKPSVLFA